MRYQFYREHKYVSHALNEVERRIARCDFSKLQECLQVEKSFIALSEMLQGHAEYENERLHSLLKLRHSSVHEHIEKDHELQDHELQEIQAMLENLKAEQDPDARVDLGYALYLSFRKFVADNLIHLHEEETKILPELQRLYSDEELQEVEAPTYQMMTVQQLSEMLNTLFPHMNRTDKEAFLADIQKCEPQKYQELLNTL